MATQTNKGGSTGSGKGGSGKGGTGKGGASDNDSSGVTGAFQSARSSTSSALQSTTRAVGSAGRNVGSNPVTAVIGGFAVGAVLGAVIPATRRERQALQPVGSKITEAARTAARQAAEAGRDKLNRVTGEVMTQVGAKVVDAVAPPAQS